MNFAHAIILGGIVASVLLSQITWIFIMIKYLVLVSSISAFFCVNFAWGAEKSGHNDDSGCSAEKLCLSPIVRIGALAEALDVVIYQYPDLAMTCKNFYEYFQRIHEKINESEGYHPWQDFPLNQRTLPCYNDTFLQYLLLARKYVQELQKKIERVAQHFKNGQIALQNKQKDNARQINRLLNKLKKAKSFLLEEGSEESKPTFPERYLTLIQDTIEYQLYYYSQYQKFIGDPSRHITVPRDPLKNRNQTTSTGGIYDQLKIEFLKRGEALNIQRKDLTSAQHPDNSNEGILVRYLDFFLPIVYDSSKNKGFSGEESLHRFPAFNFERNIFSQGTIAKNSLPINNFFLAVIVVLLELKQVYLQCLQEEENAKALGKNLTSDQKKKYSSESAVLLDKLLILKKSWASCMDYHQASVTNWHAHNFSRAADLFDIAFPGMYEKSSIMDRVKLLKNGFLMHKKALTPEKAADYIKLLIKHAIYEKNYYKAVKWYLELASMGKGLSNSAIDAYGHLSLSDCQKLETYAKNITEDSEKQQYLDNIQYLKAMLGIKQAQEQDDGSWFAMDDGSWFAMYDDD